LPDREPPPLPRKPDTDVGLTRDWEARLFSDTGATLPLELGALMERLAPPPLPVNPWSPLAAAAPPAGEVTDAGTELATREFPEYE
jgi:hypothetical protein